MSSQAQVEANIANAQLSTGPRTPEGKAASAQNARSHGLTSRDLVVAEHEREEFEQFQSELEAELRPLGPLEIGIFQQFIHAGWNLRRIRRMESELFQIEPNLLLDDKAAKAFDRLARYQTRTERSYHRALKELRQLQTNRMLRSTIEKVIADSIAPLASIASTKQTQKSAAASRFGHAIHKVDDETPNSYRNDERIVRRR